MVRGDDDEQPSPRPGRSIRSLASGVLGVGAMVAGLTIAGLMGTAGFFAVGFGVMTDCTNNYSCTETGCPPCRTAQAWLVAGALIQLALVVVTAWLLWRGRTSVRLRSYRPAIGIVVIVVSLAAIVLTTQAADSSYCRPGTPGYSESYCET